MENIKKGDKIAIISPATIVKPFWIEGAVVELTRRGYVPVLMPHAMGPAHGTFAASDADRLADLTTAIADPEIKAILCARGGYGCIHLMSTELQQLVVDNPKWLIGFSDISALHALWRMTDVPSLHCSMAKQLTLYNIAEQSEEIRNSASSETPDDEALRAIRECTDAMFSILEGTSSEIIYNAPSPEGVVCGQSFGEIVGGNLAVLNGLASTPWDILSPEYTRGKILFLEDVGEKIYQVERMLTRLYMAGIFKTAAGVIFGKFTDYKPDLNFPSMEAMISRRLREWNVQIPVSLNFPIGHVSDNRPVPEGASATLNVSPDTTTLRIYPRQ